MSKALQDAQNGLYKADQRLKYSIIAGIVFMIVMTTTIFFQLYNVQTTLSDQTREQFERNAASTKVARENLQTALDANAEQHKVTQQYVRCIGIVLLKPLAERQEQDFDSCGLEGTIDTRRTSLAPPASPETDAPSVAATPEANTPAVVQVPANTQTTTPPATTSAPPEPAAVARSQGISIVTPLLDNKFKLLGVD